MRIAPFFRLEDSEEKAHKRRLAGHENHRGSAQDLAVALAQEIMRHRLQPRHFEAWLSRFNGGPQLTERTRGGIIAFTEGAFGTPEDPDAMDPNHLEGLVAQYLWYFLCRETSEEAIVADIPPGFKSTDPGGDALMVHKLSNGQLRFRLWEIKKFVHREEGTAGTANSTIHKAYQQLRTRAMEYLARYTSIGQDAYHDLSDFFGALVDLWQDAGPQASAGVSLNTSHEDVPDDAFHDLGDRFPEFSDPMRLLGMVASVEDFEEFSMMVRDAVWKGL